MSTYPQDTLKSQDVYTFTINTLDTLPLTMPGAMQSRDLLRVLVFSAAAKLSVHQACQQLERAPSAPTVLGTLAQQLSRLDTLAGHVKDLLARLIPKGLGKHGRCVAIDVTALPYHGTVDKAHQDEVCRSKAKGARCTFSPLPPPMPWSKAAAIPGDLSCAGQAAHGARGAHPPGACGHLGHPHEAPAARSRLLQCPGDPRPDHGGVALHHAGSQTRHKAHDSGRTHRDLRASGREAKPLDHLSRAFWHGVVLSASASSA